MSLVTDISLLGEWKKQGKVFGKPIQAIVSDDKRTSKIPTGTFVPHLLVRCLDMFQKIGGYTCEGVFRKSGRVDAQTKIRDTINEGNRIPDIQDPYIVANLIKYFLCNLAEPLLTFSLYDEWMEIASLKDRRRILQMAKSTIEKLPIENRETLKVLMRCWQQVISAENQIHTRMNITGLSRVIGPCLLWSREIDMDSINKVNQLTESLIGFAKTLFFSDPIESCTNSGDAIKSHKKQKRENTSEKTGKGTEPEKAVEPSSTGKNPQHGMNSHRLSL